jgi:hypothetical protein
VTWPALLPPLLQHARRSLAGASHRCTVCTRASRCAHSCSRSQIRRQTRASRNLALFVHKIGILPFSHAHAGTCKASCKATQCLFDNQATTTYNDDLVASDWAKWRLTGESAMSGTSDRFPNLQRAIQQPRSRWGHAVTSSLSNLASERSAVHDDRALPGHNSAILQKRRSMVCTRCDTHRLPLHNPGDLERQVHPSHAIMIVCGGYGWSDNSCFC